PRPIRIGSRSAADDGAVRDHSTLGYDDQTIAHEPVLVVAVRLPGHRADLHVAPDVGVLVDQRALDVSAIRASYIGPAKPPAIRLSGLRFVVFPAQAHR